MCFKECGDEKEVAFGLGCAMFCRMESKSKKLSKSMPEEAKAGEADVNKDGVKSGCAPSGVGHGPAGSSNPCPLGRGGCQVICFCPC